MKFVIQRVDSASVKVEGKVVGSIGKGFLVFIGVGQGDTEEEADKYLKKLLGLRIFEDEQGTAVANITVYIVCQLQKRQPPKFYRGRRSEAGGRSL